jgi:hypothetical protein
VQKILHGGGTSPTTSKKMQQQGDHANNEQFCKRLEGQQQFMNYILFTDGTHFTLMVSPV